MDDDDHTEPRVMVLHLIEKLPNGMLLEATIECGGDREITRMLDEGVQYYFGRFAHAVGQL